VATALDNLAGVYVAEEKFSKAEPLYRRALAIREKAALTSFDKLASLYVGQKKYAEAERLYKRSLAIAEKMNEPVELGMVLQKYGELLRILARDGEAVEVEQRVAAIRARLAQGASPESKRPNP
jgi:tetratricopeptide (TPR) repeat protein